MMAPPDNDRFARVGTLGFLLFGILLRVLRFCLDFPLWGDEVFVCQNFWGREFDTILNQLENGQICPPLFLWCQLAVFQSVGSYDMAMRAVPLLAGVLALLGFRSMTLRLLEPRSAVLAMGLLAVAPWPVALATFAKPYSFDLLMAVLLQFTAIRCWQRPDATGRYALLALAMPLAILGSYPAAFVGGGVMLALLPQVWRGSIGAKVWFVLAGVLMLAAFVFNLEIGKHQLEGEEAPAIHNFLKDYWKDGFPPREWWNWPYWLLEAHTGRMMAYPIGDAYFGSTVTFLLFCVGLYRWIRAKRWTLLVLFLVPFALNLVAAIIGKYPYAACGRLTQHLAPAICLITASGIMQVIDWRYKLPRSQRIAMGIVVGLFLVIGVGGAIQAVAVPYHDAEAKWMRDIPRQIQHASGKRNPLIYVVGDERETPNVLRWYLRRNHALWMGKKTDYSDIDPEWFSEHLFVVDCWHDKGTNTTERMPKPLRFPDGHIIRGRVTYHLRAESETDPFRHCQVTVYGPADSPEVVFNSQP